TNVLYNCWISDVMTCHKAMSTELFRSLRLRERGFGIEPEITARVLLAGERIFEVPITYKARSREEGKKLTALDGLRVLRPLARCRIAWRSAPFPQSIVVGAAPFALDPPARERRDRAPASRLSEPHPTRAVVEPAGDRLAPEAHGARRHEEPRDAVLDRVEQAADRRRHDRPAVRHRLARDH